jgi:TonB family protein
MQLIGLTRAVALTTLTFTLSATPTWGETILAEKISEVIKIENQTKKISVLNYLLYKILSFKNITHSILILLLGLGNSTSFGHLPKHSNHINQYAQNTRRYTISGSLELINLYGISGEGNNCFGRSGYQDIRGGTQIIIKDGSGKVLAIGKISNGRSPAWQYFQHICRFTFKISNISRTNFYSIKIGRRGEIFYSYQDLVRQNWNVNLTLGSTKQELDESIRRLENLGNLGVFNTPRLPTIDNRTLIPPSANQTNLSRRAACIRCNTNYPEFARRQGIEGRVELSVDIDAKGDVTNVRILRSSGNEKLDEDVKRQASNWKFQPSEGGRQGISIAIQITFFR